MTATIIVTGLKYATGNWTTNISIFEGAGGRQYIFPSLETSTLQLCGQSGASGSVNMVAELISAPLLRGLTSSDPRLFRASTCANLIDIVVGELTTILNCAAWNPTNVISDSTKLATLNKNIRDHIASRVSDRTGLTALTFKVSSNLLANLEAETIAAFTAKNWNVSA